MTDQQQAPPRFSAGAGKPVHEHNPEATWGQALCGVRRQFRHRDTQDAVTCPRCLTAKARGRAYPRGSR